jgi:hypothetical protein
MSSMQQSISTMQQ